MNNLKIPTSRDISIEVNGKKVAVVQAYNVKTTKESTPIEAFGSDAPVATINGRQAYYLELTKVIPTGEAISEKLDFYSLTNFTLMVVKPDQRIVYSACEWYDIAESGSLNKPCFEKIKIVANRRMVIV